MKIGIIAVAFVLIALAVLVTTRARHRVDRTVLESSETPTATRQFSIGSTSCVAPEGWQQIAKADGKLVLRSPDDRQQLTMSMLLLKDKATFEEFKKLCALRLKAERQELSDGFITPESPEVFRDNGTFGMFYSGGDKKNQRMFTTYLSLKGNEFLTVYLEGLDVAPEVHANTFKQFFASLKR